jgi:hypothetical protein
MNFKCVIVCLVFFWDSVVVTVTCCGLDGLGIKSRWGEIFDTHPDWPWGPSSLQYKGYWLSFPGVKQPGPGVNQPPPSSAGVKEGVKLYLYSPSGPSQPVIG